MSEIARIKAQIELESAAARHALHSPSLGTAKHAFITRKMEEIGKLHDGLMGMVGEERAIRFLVKAIDG